MFKSTNYAVALLLLSSAKAVKVKNEYRPPSGSVPWHLAANTRPLWDTPSWPVNYFIPNFGLDHNVLTTQNSLRVAETGAKKGLKASFAATDKPADMRIPDNGQDADIKQSLASMGEAEKETGFRMNKPMIFGQKYVTYNQSMGDDEEVGNTRSSIQFAEKKMGQKYTPPPIAMEAPVAYQASLGNEEDIAMTQANIAETEKMYGKFVPVKDYDGVWRVGKEEATFAQTQADIHLDSDPICSSAGCTQYKHEGTPRGYPINYPVPSFGMDNDIKGGLANLKVAEKTVGHEWTSFGTPESKAKWANPAKKTMYNFAPELDGNIVDAANSLKIAEKQLDHKYQLLQLDEQSDPICSSAGCTQYKHPESKLADWPMNYPVPHFGMDRDIQGAFENLDAAEKIVGHKLVMGTGESKKKWANPARKIMYNFAPELDGDIQDSQKNLADTEKKLDHEYSLD